MATYDPRSDFDVKKAQKRFNHFLEKKVPFEMKGLSGRTIPQNSKFHAIIGQIGIHTGNNAKYVKLNIVKMKWCRSIFYVEDFNLKNGDSYYYVRSSKDLSKEEMSKVIEIMIEKASLELNMIFPSEESKSNNEDWIKMIQEVENNQKYL